MGDGYWRYVFNTQISYFLNETLNISILGTDMDVSYVLKRCQELNIQVHIIHTSTNFKEYEHKALTYLDENARKHEGISIYLHTKGVSQPKNKFKFRWREYIHIHFLRHWKKMATQLFASNFNTCGALFLRDTENYCLTLNKPFEYFAGNIWMAKNSYIRSLVEYKKYITESDRYLAESWIGEGNIQPLYIDQDAPLDSGFRKKFNYLKLKTFFKTYFIYYRFKVFKNL